MLLRIPECNRGGTLFLEDFSQSTRCTSSFRECHCLRTSRGLQRVHRPSHASGSRGVQAMIFSALSRNNQKPAYHCRKVRNTATLVRHNALQACFQNHYS